MQATIHKHFPTLLSTHKYKTGIANTLSMYIIVYNNLMCFIILRFINM